jgi:hypothetical protein
VKPVYLSEFGRESQLHCPDCGEPQLHQEAVEVFDRSEDAIAGAHVVVNGDSVTVDRDVSRNPSPRRQGLRIALHCESCGPVGYLEIYQHKGSTYLHTSKD